MAMTFEAVYENGVLRPLESLALPNLQHVLVTISVVPATADDVAGYFEPEEWRPRSMMTSASRRFGGRSRQFRDRSRTQ
jgi:predicted DNA-binding antitoxin AbrB/MazE fold protein